MLKKRKDFNEEEYLKQLEIKMKKREYDKQKVRSKDYEDWLVEILDKRNEITSYEEIYLYVKPDGITDDDVDNIFLLGDYWNYKNSETKYIKSPCDENDNLDDLLSIELDKAMQIEIQGKTYKFSKEAGLGCYVYTIKKLIKEPPCDVEMCLECLHYVDIDEECVLYNFKNIIPDIKNCKRE